MRGLLFVLAVALAGVAAESGPATFRPGEKLVLKGRDYFVETIDEQGRLILSPPLPPTATIGAFITPVRAEASAAQDQAGRTATKMIDGSGWGETFPGSGVYHHVDDVYTDGGCMWNGTQNNTWILFDLGREYRVAGIYLWNYNEKGGWHTRSIKDVDVSYSTDQQTWRELGRLTFAPGSGKPAYAGEVKPFAQPVTARWFRFDIRTNYRGGEMSGVAEIRFANADQPYVPATPTVWQPKYPRPEHPRLTLGQRLEGAENIVYPADSGIVDVTRPPYNAKGDGVTDDTKAIQAALDDHPNQGAIIYLPNGRYRISDTLRWPHGKGGGAEEKRTVLRGQSRRGAILQLPDSCPGFENPQRPKACIWTGRAPAQRFGNEIHNLTVDTGVDNPGAIGVQFIANNQGGMYDVTIVSGDGQGKIGLDLGYTDEQGPCFIKRLKVVGFDVGVQTKYGVASETLEFIEVEHQNQFGFRNDGQPCTIRRLTSRNEVPAFRAGGGLSTLIEAELTGLGAARETAAVICDGNLLVRDLTTSGYLLALQDLKNDRQLAGPAVDQYLSRPAVALTGEPTAGLRLPIKETPDVPWDDPATWVTPQRFGAVANDGQDDAAALQQAIDSGATTVYLPRGGYRIGQTVIVRGNVRRLVGGKAWLQPMAPLTGQAAPLFRVENGAAPVVLLEHLDTDFSRGPFRFLDNVAERTLVLSKLGINFQGAEAYRGTGRGEVFLEDVVGRWFKFTGQTVWARQFNIEGDGLHLLNDGGTVWVLGYKTEGGGTLVETRNNGRTEILGGLSYTVGEVDESPLIALTDSQVAVTLSEVCHTNRPFQVIVRETRAGQTRQMLKDDDRWGRCFTLFTAPGR